MGNKRNSKRKWETQHRSLPPTIRHDLKESIKGSYFNQRISPEEQSIENECIVEKVDSDIIEEELDIIVSASERKILSVPPADYEEDSENAEKHDQEVTEEGSRIIDISLLTSALQIAAKCASCNSLGLNLREKTNGRRGWASTLYFYCTNCEKKTFFSTSPNLQNDMTKSKVVNR